MSILYLKQEKKKTNICLTKEWGRPSLRSLCIRRRWRISSGAAVLTSIGTWTQTPSGTHRGARVAGKEPGVGSKVKRWGWSEANRKLGKNPGDVNELLNPNPKDRERKTGWGRMKAVPGCREGLWGAGRISLHISWSTNEASDLPDSPSGDGYAPYQQCCYIHNQNRKADDIIVHSHPHS